MKNGIPESIHFGPGIFFGFITKGQWMRKGPIASYLTYSFEIVY